MLYETLNQPMLLLVFAVYGVVSGLVFDIGNFIKFLCANKKIISIVIDFVQTSIILLGLFFVNLNYNYGLIRLYPLLIFALTFLVERVTLGKLIAKIYLSCYNFFIKFIQKIKNRRRTNAKTDKTN